MQKWSNYITSEGKWLDCILFRGIKPLDCHDDSSWTHWLEHVSIQRVTVEGLKLSGVKKNALHTSQIFLFKKKRKKRKQFSFYLEFKFVIYKNVTDLSEMNTYARKSNILTQPIQINVMSPPQIYDAFQAPFVHSLLDTIVYRL